MLATEQNKKSKTHSDVAKNQSARLDKDPIADLEILQRIQNRVLWLTMQIVHYANFLREDKATKVGGHQASSASVVSLMSALYFRALRPGDWVSVKPHASPVYHAIQFLLGNLPAEKLKQFRSFKGLQAYPSRTKDVDEVDFSTGSVGLGAVAPNFAALTRQFLQDHFDDQAPNRFIAIVGDAELDEGNVWEALGEENFQGLSQVLWIVDLNRQSLDRVVPSGKVRKIEDMFRINGWHVLELKYGQRLEEAYARPGGERLRERIDLMTNDEYQSLLRLPAERVREKLPCIDGSLDRELLRLLDPYSNQEVKTLIADLGGHDLSKILKTYDEADRITDRPVVIVAYTIKGWGLPIAGDPLNHSKLLTAQQMEELRQQLGIAKGEEFAGFAEDSPEACYIRAYRSGFEHKTRRATSARLLPPIPIPDSLDNKYTGQLSTQRALGTILTSLSRVPGVGARIVTTSPDVATSTNLGGWINKMGVYCHQAKTNFFRENAIALMLNWEQTPRGQHIELGISENNLFLLLSMLGLSHEISGEVLLPVGTIYDTFIVRGLDALTYAAYSGAKFIFAGTPSGITLSSEGGAHQSIITPSIGIETPNLVYYEPCFAKELEWIFLAGLRNLLDRQKGQIVYLRLSTQPVPQDLFPEREAANEAKSKRLRDDVVRGGYRIVDLRDEPSYAPGDNVVNVFACGVMVPLAIEASRLLRDEGVFANVVNVTSPDLLYKSWQEANRMKMNQASARTSSHLERLIPLSERMAPIVTVMDGHPHALSFIGGVFGAKTISLGVSEFGQSGTRDDLYDHYGISAKAIVQAACAAL